jgi:chromosome segregation ATPase
MDAPRMKTIGWTSLILAIAGFMLAGCDDTDLKHAQQEAMQAKAEVSRLQLRLQRAEQKSRELEDEKNNLREMRDAINGRANQLARENEKVSALAVQAQQTATTLAARADNEADTMASLREQVTQLKSVVAEQQATIRQYQSALDQVRQYIVQGSAASQSLNTSSGDNAAGSDTNQNPGGEQ